MGNTLGWYDMTSKGNYYAVYGNNENNILQNDSLVNAIFGA
jgi:hypothetical protein